MKRIRVPLSYPASRGFDGASQAACQGGSFAVESVAAFAWNGWQASSGISGNLGLEYAQLEKLKVSATQWLEAERLRQYIDAVEQAAVRNGELNEELKDWISWARIKADCMDPLIAVSDAILDGPEPKSPGYFY